MAKAITQHPIYGPQMKDSLLSLPSISLVTSAGRPHSREIETSVELLYPDGTAGFMTRAERVEAQRKHRRGEHIRERLPTKEIDHKEVCAEDCHDVDDGQVRRSDL